MKYRLIMAGLLVMSGSCTTSQNYREARTIDVNQEPIAGVQVFPQQQLFGPASKLSDRNGFLLVPKNESFSLRKAGYRDKYIDGGDIQNDYVLDIETRTFEEVVKERAAQFRERMYPPGIRYYHLDERNYPPQ